MPIIIDGPAKASFNGVDITGFVRELGLELSPWQMRAVEALYAEAPDARYDQAVIASPRRNGHRYLSEMTRVIAAETHRWISAEQEFTLKMWWLRRAFGWPPARVAVDGDRVIWQLR